MKTASRENIFNKNSNSLLNSILNAVFQGYTTKVIINDIIEEVENGNISKGKFLSVPEALEDWANEYNSRIKEIIDDLRNYDFAEDIKKIQPKKKIETSDLMVNLNDFKKKEDEDEIEENINEEAQEETKEIENVNKTAKIQKVAMVNIKENWQKSEFDENKGVLKGELLLTFNNDLSDYTKNKEFKTFPKEINEKKLISEMMKYLYKQYSWLRKNIKPESENIFQKYIIKDEKKGIVLVPFLIKKAEG